MFTLKEILSYTQGKILNNNTSYSNFIGISTDTRTIKEGMIFLALSGENFDGHNFLYKAFENGAKAFIVNDNKDIPKDINLPIIGVKDTLMAYLNIASNWRDQFNIPLIAITGSNGKTTTKDLTAAVLSAKYKVCKTLKNFNSEIGLAKTLLSMNKDDEICVVEMGMRGMGQIDLLAKIAKPQVGIVLNVGDAHMELLGSKENIAKAKSELILNLPKSGIGILNNDDLYVAKMSTLNNLKYLTFGIDKKSDVMAQNIKVLENGHTQFTCIYNEREFICEIPLIGKHNVYDALAAICVGLKMNLTDKEIIFGLKSFQSSGMRFEIEQWRDYFLINDAYNASPDSVRSSILAMNEFSKGKGRKILVFGDMKELGNLEKESHQQIGEFCVKQKIDILLTLGDLAKLTSDTAKNLGLLESHNFLNHNLLSKYLFSILKNNDIILVKGSHSMHMERVIELLKNI